VTVLFRIINVTTGLVVPNVVFGTRVEAIEWINAQLWPDHFEIRQVGE
jgi:hypothetical protein